jgi:hypothetical protein
MPAEGFSRRFCPSIILELIGMVVLDYPLPVYLVGVGVRNPPASYGWQHEEPGTT